MQDATTTSAAGFRVLPGHLSEADQKSLLACVYDAICLAPLFAPRMPRTGKPFSVRMTNLGPLGWMSDEGGYRYEPRHPVTGAPWPAMPALLLDLWDRLTGYGAPPEACLVNYYGAGARMGLHVDADEAALDAPVLSVSLGDTALFRLGGPERKSPTRSLRLASGDVCLLAGESRHFYHGIDRVIGGTSRLLEGPALAALGVTGGRINLTLRRVTVPN